ncbi:phospholipase D-like domain-containing protein [Pyxidicoccus caerfyrddinensis]|uniref:phospholipase D-like domain-containing protein n=1 Tax=Pyxidicoccus caerfyrddinensis TaxID=2709663 RepID=UPI0013DCCD42|nr:phospholipase D family protein [Pyxidicoccus caerfyrddinensis]
MKTKVLTSTPLYPLAEVMQKLSMNCVLFWGASAFVTQSAVEYVIGAALSTGAQARFLTGTFGRNTRKATFEHLRELAKQYPSFKTKVWSCGSHGKFHAKICLWRLSSGEAVAWIGSANLTDGGLQNQGELVLEVRGEWGSATIRRLRKAFESEWKKGQLLSSTFVNTYREAKRLPPDSAPIQGRMRRKRKRMQIYRERFFVTNVTRHIPEDSSVAEHVNGLFGGTAEHWVRHSASPLFEVLPGDMGLLCDTVVQFATVVEVTDIRHDGTICMLAYEPIVKREYKRDALQRLKRAGVHVDLDRAPRTRWMDAQVGVRVLKEMRRK